MQSYRGLCRRHLNAINSYHITAKLSYAIMATGARYGLSPQGEHATIASPSAHSLGESNMLITAPFFLTFSALTIHQSIVGLKSIKKFNLVARQWPQRSHVR